MRINSISASFDSTRLAAPARAAKSRTEATTAPQLDVAATAPVLKARAHGVIKKLGTGHYSDKVETKLTARFAPDRLAQPAPVSDPVTDPVSDPTTDPVLDPQQPTPAGETPTDIQPLPETDIVPDASIGDKRPDETKPADSLLLDATSAFANFNVLDFIQPSRIDLIA